MSDRWDRVFRRFHPALGKVSIEDLLPSGDAIFLHRPHGKLYHGITPEVGRDFDRLTRLVLANHGTKRYLAPADLTFVTYNSRHSKSRIELCYEAYGLNELVVLGKEVTQWDWSVKVRLVLDYLEAGNCSTRYLIATDADDVLIVNDPATLLDRFRGYSCDLLFCNTFVDWPPNNLYRDFETLKYYKNPLHCRLSAGGYVGEREALVRYLRMLIEAYEKKEEWAFFNGAFDDQLGWRGLHYKYFPKIQVDTACRIFKRFDIFKDYIE
jgi:hypothetical protein